MINVTGILSCDSSINPTDVDHMFDAVRGTSAPAAGYTAARRYIAPASDDEVDSFQTQYDQDMPCQKNTPNHQY